MAPIAQQPLTVLNSVKAMLVGKAEVDLVYVTAEFQPFSSAFKPDLLIKLRSGPHRFHSVLAEFTKTLRVFQGQPIVDLIRERKIFAEEYLEQSLNQYLIFTDLEIDQFTSTALSKNRIFIESYSEIASEIESRLVLRLNMID